MRLACGWPVTFFNPIRRDQPRPTERDHLHAWVLNWQRDSERHIRDLPIVAMVVWPLVRHW
jgi:hypothetical protein